MTEKELKQEILNLCKTVIDKNHVMMNTSDKQEIASQEINIGFELQIINCLSDALRAVMK